MNQSESRKATSGRPHYYAACALLHVLSSKTLWHSFRGLRHGKFYLASLSEADLEDRLRNTGLQAYTPRTITEIGKLKKVAASVRRSGYAVAEEELTEGLRGIAGPVFDP